eukprot:3135322-Amphidinium_carterae.1
MEAVSDTNVGNKVVSKNRADCNLQSAQFEDACGEHLRLHFGDAGWTQSTRNVFSIPLLIRIVDMHVLALRPAGDDSLPSSSASSSEVSSARSTLALHSFPGTPVTQHPRSLHTESLTSLKSELDNPVGRNGVTIRMIRYGV